MSTTNASMSLYINIIIIIVIITTIINIISIIISILIILLIIIVNILIIIIINIIIINIRFIFRLIIISFTLARFSWNPLTLLMSRCNAPMRARHPAFPALRWLPLCGIHSSLHGRRCARQSCLEVSCAYDLVVRTLAVLQQCCRHHG